MAPTHVAHDVVNYGLAVGKDALAYSKSKPGMVKWTVEKIEGPVSSVLGSKLGQTAIKVGDRAVTVADGTIDKAMNTGVYKSSSRVVKTTYTNRILPATSAVKKTCARASTAVTTPVVNTVNKALELADRSVEYMLPEADAKIRKEDQKLPKTVVGLSRKISRRSVRKVAATRKMVASTAAYALEQSKPANIKKNTVLVYSKTLAGADKLVDTYLPDSDKLVGKTPVMLVKKLAKRSKTHTVAMVKKVATAIKNAPTTFKKACSDTYKKITVQAMKLRKLKLKLMTVAEAKEKVATLLEAGKAKGALYVAATDKLLLKYQYPAALRNFGVNFYLKRLAPIIQPVLAKVLGEKPKTTGFMAAIKPARSAAPVRSAPPPKVASPTPAAPVAEPEEEDAEETVEEKEFESQAM